MRVRKRGLAACLVILGVTFSAWGASFRETPPVAWAYTLRGGELLLGTGLSLGLGGYLSSSLEAAFGVMNGLQAGVSVAHVGLAQQSVYWTLGVKGRLPLAPDLQLGFPLGLSFGEEHGHGTLFRGVTGGVVLSLAQGPLAAHGQAELWLTRYGLFLLLSGGLDYDLGPALRVGAQAQLPLPGLVPSLSATAWLRPLPFLDIRLALHPLALALEGTVHLRLKLF